MVPPPQPQEGARCDCSRASTQQLWNFALKMEHREFEPVVFGNGQGHLADGPIEWLQANWPPIHTPEKSATIDCYSPANHYCPDRVVPNDGWKHYVKCPKYTTSPEGSYALADCKPIAGYSTPIAAKDPAQPLLLEATLCPPNTYCPEGQNLPSPNPCPDHTKSPAGSIDQAQCKAIASYQAAAGHEVSIQVGESIKVVRKHPSGWWEGITASGEAGWFPSTYVTDVRPIQFAR